MLELMWNRSEGKIWKFITVVEVKSNDREFTSICRPTVFKANYLVNSWIMIHMSCMKIHEFVIILRGKNDVIVHTADNCTNMYIHNTQIYINTYVLTNVRKWYTLNRHVKFIQYTYTRTFHVSIHTHTYTHTYIQT